MVIEVYFIIHYGQNCNTKWNYFLLQQGNIMWNCACAGILQDDRISQVETHKDFHASILFLLPPAFTLSHPWKPPDSLLFFSFLLSFPPNNQLTLSCSSIFPPTQLLLRKSLVLLCSVGCWLAHLHSRESSKIFFGRGTLSPACLFICLLFYVILWAYITWCFLYFV